MADGKPRKYPKTCNGMNAARNELSALGTNDLAPEAFSLTAKMEGAGSKSPLKSEVFKIVVGPSKDVFYAHSNILAKSEVLKKTVEGDFK
ncbi:MAG: hypothetical protein L6R40_004239 [Gallowayella cf. fulva]|nr:MAG: hypothetical protein L6R40_004239 [Xanthomendoza cf. fulva]